MDTLIQGLTTYLTNMFNFTVNLSIKDVLLPFDKFMMLILITIGWTVFYFIIHFMPFKCSQGTAATLDTKNRIVSIVHASIVFVLSLIDFFYYQSDKCGSENYAFQTNILLFSCGYFIYDILISIYFNILDFGMLVHHLFVITSEYFGLVFNNSASEMIRAMISAEVSNPIMHIRKIISNFGMKDTKLFLFLEYVYFVLYIVFRTTLGLQITLWTVFCMDNLFLVKLGGTVVIVQSFLYTGNMITILKKRKIEQDERNKENVALYWFSFNDKISQLEYFKKSKLEKYVP